MSFSPPSVKDQQFVINVTTIIQTQVITMQSYLYFTINLVNNFSDIPV